MPPSSRGNSGGLLPLSGGRRGRRGGSGHGGGGGGVASKGRLALGGLALFLLAVLTTRSWRQADVSAGAGERDVHCCICKDQVLVFLCSRTLSAPPTVCDTRPHTPFTTTVFHISRTPQRVRFQRRTIGFRTSVDEIFSTASLLAVAWLSSKICSSVCYLVSYAVSFLSLSLSLVLFLCHG